MSFGRTTIVAAEVKFILLLEFSFPSVRSFVPIFDMHHTCMHHGYMHHGYMHHVYMHHIMDTCIMDTCEWVTWPERPKGAKNEVKRPPAAKPAASKADYSRLRQTIADQGRL